MQREHTSEERMTETRATIDIKSKIPNISPEDSEQQAPCLLNKGHQAHGPGRQQDMNTGT